MKLGYCKKQLLKQPLFFFKKYTNKFIENVGQNVTKTAFSDTSGDRGQRHLKWSSFVKILRVVNLDI